MDPIEVFNKLASSASASISDVVAGIMGGLLMRGNTRKAEFEKLKAGYFDEVARDLINQGHLSNFEYYKLTNFLKVAELADKYCSGTDNPNAVKEDQSSENTKRSKSANKSDFDFDFDFDWYIRFYEYSGRVSSADMQQLWGKVLAGKVKKEGKFHYKTLETLWQLDSETATEFATLCKLIVYDNCDSYSFISTTEIIPDINYEYELDGQAFNRIADAGLILGVRSECRMFDNLQDTFFFYNENIIVEVNPKTSSALNMIFYVYPLSSSGKDIYEIAEIQADDNYLLDIAFFLKVKYEAELNVTANPIISVTSDAVVGDKDINLLEGYYPQNDKIINLYKKM